MQCRQGQNQEIHDLLYGCAIEEAAYQRMFSEKSEPAACRVIEGSKREGDEYVQQNTGHIAGSCRF
jgi:hypothetical protein